MKRIIYLITVVLAIIILQSCCRNCFLGRYTRSLLSTKNGRG